VSVCVCACVCVYTLTSLGISFTRRSAFNIYTNTLAHSHINRYTHTHLFRHLLDQAVGIRQDVIVELLKLSRKHELCTRPWGDVCGRCLLQGQTQMQNLIQRCRTSYIDAGSYTKM